MNELEAKENRLTCQCMGQPMRAHLVRYVDTLT
jgi:hypothetical protein